MKLLYIDDEDINLFLFEKTFRKDFEVYTASSGKEGLKILQEHPDIKTVISDMRMPVMNGLEFIKEANKTYRNIKFFLLTGYHKTQEIEEALACKLITNYFTKPFRSEVLKKEITMN